MTTSLLAATRIKPSGPHSNPTRYGAWSDQCRGFVSPRRLSTRARRPSVNVQDSFAGDAAAEQGLGGLGGAAPAPAPVDLRVELACGEQPDEVREVGAERPAFVVHLEAHQRPPGTNRAARRQHRRLARGRAD